ncbi:hypothetical protein VTN77DRAFT_6712 [Rasamsonia byssochlamydoides]|uniref:uncharacterized protein n=1 Tax=Rasamsonia byssochlamydoides TaxID=89139 RepID=UPI0037420027
MVLEAQWGRRRDGFPDGLWILVLATLTEIWISTARNQPSRGSGAVGDESRGTVSIQRLTVVNTLLPCYRTSAVPHASLCRGKEIPSGLKIQNSIESEIESPPGRASRAQITPALALHTP